ncbi:MAG TPA: HAMP domain-containing sensor histidine kinase [Candidatus Methylacidiphilales bacterium]|nr:HAMP domain-containing sensor histidine kinase [Candidatus Methylacidiphilales bacterium]
MKTSFPLFARLLLWFFVNLLLLIAGLVLMVRAQFGSLDNWLLPESSQAQIQAMSVDLIGNLAHSARRDWGGELAQLSAAYKMDFALFDFRGQWIDGAKLEPPEKIRRALVYAPPSHPANGPPSGPGMPPPGGPAEFNPQPGGPLPPEAQPNRLPPRQIPDFPKFVLRSNAPSAYWLLVRLPPEPLQADGPVTLVGMTPSLGVSPLLFNPKPWIAVAAGIILFSILFWLPMARNLTSPITQMTRATESIAEGRFDIQLSDSRRDELGRLSHAINRMAARLKALVTGQKRFLGDAAHELCSPLARMEIALGILEERADAKSLPYVRDVREEVTHMRKLANELLSFSKASLGEGRVKLEPVNVAEIIEAAIRLEKSDHCPIESAPPRDLFVRGNFELLQRAVANLLRNALRYAGAAGSVSINAWREQDRVFITVSDQGPGVSPRELDKLFDPFYRVDPSRTAETGGAGLGLAIVKTCVEACGGVVRATNRIPHGLEVRICLNRAESGEAK